MVVSVFIFVFFVGRCWRLGRGGLGCRCPRHQRHAQCGGLAALVGVELGTARAATEPASHRTRADVGEVVGPLVRQRLGARHGQPEPQQVALAVELLVVLEIRARMHGDIVVQQLQVALFELHREAQARVGQ